MKNYITKKIKSININFNFKKSIKKKTFKQTKKNKNKSQFFLSIGNINKK